MMNGKKGKRERGLKIYLYDDGTPVGRSCIGVSVVINHVWFHYLVDSCPVCVNGYFDAWFRLFGYSNEGRNHISCYWFEECRT